MSVPRTQPIMSHELVVDPKTKGVAYGFAYTRSAQGRQSRGRQGPAREDPKVELDQKNCEFRALCPAAAPGPDARDQVERPGQATTSASPVSRIPASIK